MENVTKEFANYRKKAGSCMTGPILCTPPILWRRYLFILERYANPVSVDNVQVWGYGTSAAALVVAVMGPVPADLYRGPRGMKKKLFTGFLAAGVLFTLMMAVFDQWQLLLAGYVISYIGFAGSCLFYDSFTYRRHHRGADDGSVSSWGYAMGYIGGSTIPFVMSIAVLLIMGMDNPAAVKFSRVDYLCVVLSVFSIPILKMWNQTHYIELSLQNCFPHLPELKENLKGNFSE